MRTYVTYGGKPGVYFFSLDAANLPAVWAARALYHLRYFHAAMRCEELDGAIHYHSRRHGTAAELIARYGPVADVQIRDNDSIERWLADRALLPVLGRSRARLSRRNSSPAVALAGCPRGFHGQNNGAGGRYRATEVRSAAAFCSQAGSSPMASAPGLGLFLSPGDAFRAAYNSRFSAPEENP